MKKLKKKNFISSRLRAPGKTNAKKGAFPSAEAFYYMSLKDTWNWGFHEVQLAQYVNNESLEPCLQK